jgi:hypothetical protein
MDWKARHLTAMASTEITSKRLRPHHHETALVGMLKSWQTYAMAHQQMFESKIGDDGVLGPAWQEIGEAMRTLLNGELGQLDGGAMDRAILDTLEANGCGER